GLAREQREHALAVADVEAHVREAAQRGDEPIARARRVAARAEEVGAHVVVDAHDLEAEGVEELRGLRSDEATASGHEDAHAWASTLPRRTETQKRRPPHVGQLPPPL